MQGISAIIAPIVSTTLYQVDKQIPMAIVAILAVFLGVIMMINSKNRLPAKNL